MQRRGFVINMMRAGAGLSLMMHLPSILQAKQSVSANDKIGFALIGCKGMGWANTMSMLKIPELQLIALCDIDDEVLANRKSELEKLNITPQLYKDYRKLLEHKDIDVVIIATPDHWHCLMMADACAAGKHVYVEKPAANSITEANAMIKAANRYNKIVQVNQWQRSQQHFNDAIQFVHDGKLGLVSQAKVWMFNGHDILPAQPDKPVPKGVDYNLWLGPAPKRAFNSNRFHYNFRWYWDYAGGLMTDWGVHLIDMVLAGMKAGMPSRISSFGGHLAYPGDARETPDTQTALYDFGHFQMSWEHTMGRQYGLYGMGHGIAFIGDKGTLLLNRSGWEVKPEMINNKPEIEAMPWQKVKENGLDAHTVNFITAVKANDKLLLNCSIETGAHVAKVCHMGNIAYRTQSQLHWNNKGETFLEKSANQLMAAKYYNGWKMPV